MLCCASLSLCVCVEYMDLMVAIPLLASTLAKESVIVFPPTILIPADGPTAIDLTLHYNIRAEKDVSKSEVSSFNDCLEVVWFQKLQK